MDSEHAPGSGHNSIGGPAAEILRRTVERYERLDEEKKAIGADQKDILAQAKSAGLDVRIIRKILTLRKMDEQERIETEELLDLYRHALGMA
jgi:uncharacterized protein (UPF0335 family)